MGVDAEITDHGWDLKGVGGWLPSSCASGHDPVGSRNTFVTRVGLLQHRTGVDSKVRIRRSRAIPYE